MDQHGNIFCFFRHFEFLSRASGPVAGTDQLDFARESGRDRDGGGFRKLLRHTLFRLQESASVRSREV